LAQAGKFSGKPCYAVMFVMCFVKNLEICPIFGLSACKNKMSASPMSRGAILAQDL